MTGLYNDGGGAKHARITTGGIAHSSTVSVTLTWTTAFGDANYTPVCNVLDSSGFLSVAQINNLQASSIAVNITNSDSTTGDAGVHTGTLLCHAFHD